MKYTVFVFLIVSLSAYSQEKTTDNKSGLKGKVKSVKETEFPVGKNGHKKRKPGNTIIYNYFGNGDETEMISYSGRGAQKTRIAYSYDVSGKRISSTESIKRKPGNHSAYLYNEKGYQIEEDEYDANNVLVNKHLFKYDNDGRQVEYQSCFSDGSLEFKSENSFDGAGNTIEERYTDADGKLEFKLTFTYDDQGNEHEVSYYKPDGSPDYKLTYKYEDIDKEGNWLKETTLQNDKPTVITERKIEYYSN